MSGTDERAKDPFDLLGIPPGFAIDLGAVEGAWLRLAARLHPDRSGGVHPDEAMDQLAVINDARKTLIEPELRANLLLARLGGASKEADRSLPEGFLVEMLEVREQAEEARQSGDGARWAAFQAWAAQRRSEHMANVGAMFAGLGAAPDVASLRAIRTELNAWRYVERMLEQLEESRGVG